MVRDASHDFDFLFGDWTMTGRKLAHPLSHDSTWVTVDGTLTSGPLPVGVSNYDAFKAEKWKPGFVGMSLRVYNPQTGLWSDFWINNHDGGLDPKTGNLGVPVVGGFKDGKAIMEAEDTLNGKPIRVRYTWTHPDPKHAHWEQAFSTDGGANWETNWIADFERAS
ncbi:MAG: hypothetical protein JO142_07185 [Burkholderiales bacterium]|nr:hypothetical protein [Burkholderiales bacterium]